MKMKFLVLGVCCVALGLAGCTSTLDGKHTFSSSLLNDEVEGRYERPMDQVLKATKDTLMYNGQLLVENVIGKTFEARIDTRKVWVLVESVSPSLTRVLIQVRTKGGGTDPRLAGELDKQIALRLATGNLTPATAPARKP
jgi:hypothetical protein